MELQQLRYVCAVAQTGSFSRAAERCQVAQPSLSQQVLKLEQELGVKLFDRLGRSVHLTEAGRSFLPHARSVLEHTQAARASVASAVHDVSGGVCIGAIPTVGPYLLPRYAASFAAQFPEATLRIVEEMTPVLVERLRNHSIDLALLALPLRHKDLDFLPLLSEPIYAVLPKQHPRAEAKSLSLKSLRGEPFVMLRDGHCFRDLSLSLCKTARFAPTVTFEGGQFSSVLAMVGAGVGISLAPEMAIQVDPAFSSVRLADGRARRTIVLAKLRGRTLNYVQRGLAAFISPEANFER